MKTLELTDAEFYQIAGLVHGLNKYRDEAILRDICDKLEVCELGSTCSVDPVTKVRKKSVVKSIGEPYICNTEHVDSVAKILSKSERMLQDISVVRYADKGVY